MKKILLVSLTAAMLVTTVQAANNDSVEVPLSGRVILPLEVSLANSGIVLPDMASPRSTDSTATVTLNCNSDGTSTVAYTGESNPFANGVAAAEPVSTSSANVTNNVGNSTGTCAELTVSGEAGYHYVASMFAAPLYSSPFEESNITCNVDASGSGIIGTTGLYCGAKVTVTDAASGSSFNYTTSGGHGVVGVVYD